MTLRYLEVPAGTQFCFMCWHGSCESCNPAHCDCWCCETDAKDILTSDGELAAEGDE